MGKGASRRVLTLEVRIPGLTHSRHEGGLIPPRLIQLSGPGLNYRRIVHRSGGGSIQSRRWIQRPLDESTAWIAPVR
eukprot:2282987-Prymnesium_polylepis.1